MSAGVATNKLHFRHSKNLSNLLLTTQPIYIPKDSHCNWGISYNTYLLFIYIYTIHPTSFDYGILLNVNKQIFHRFYITVALIIIDIMVRLISTVM